MDLDVGLNWWRKQKNRQWRDPVRNPAVDPLDALAAGSSPDIRNNQRCQLASPMHRIAQMEHPVALEDHFGILEHQVALGERPEVRLPPAEDDRHDVDRHVVDSPSDMACPPTSPAPTPISPSPANT
jgi:hypothetical protein